MKRRFIYIIVSVFVLMLTSCTEDDTIQNTDPIVGLGGDSYTENDIDRWIYEQFTKPYNIAVKYRWSPWESSLTAMVTPVKEECVIPVMELIRDVWIGPYKHMKGEEFIKDYAPKNYVLIGSPRYNTNGTITLGEAEGGNKVTLYRLNWWVTNNPDEYKDLVQRILRTTHHEFTHTLNQIIRYPEEFMYITASESAWTNVSDEAARDKGYISPYASDSPGEDFAEMLAYILIYGREWFDARVAAANSTAKLLGKEITAQQALRQKETILIAYLKQSFGIDFYGTADNPGLHELVQEAIKKYLDEHIN